MEGENQVVENQPENGAQSQENQPEVNDAQDHVNSVLAEKFGEGFSMSSIEKLRSDYDKLSTEYKNEKIKYEEQRYATPLSRKIDEMFRKEGVGVPHVLKYLSLQGLNLNEMKPEDVIKQKLSMERPEFTAKELDVWFNDKFGRLDEDDEDANDIRNVRIKEAYLDAKKYLEEQMVESEDPKVAETKKQEEAAQQALRDRYSVRVESLMKQTEKIPYSLKTKEFEYGFEFPIPKDDQVNKGIAQAVINYAVSEGLPLDGTADGKIKEFINSIVERVYHKEIVEAIIRDGWASSRRDAVVAQSNPSTVPAGSGSMNNQKPPQEKKRVVQKKGHTFV